MIGYLLSRSRIIAFSSGFGIWHGTNTMVRLLNFDKKYGVIIEYLASV